MHSERPGVEVLPFPDAIKENTSQWVQINMPKLPRDGAGEAPPPGTPPSLHRSHKLFGTSIYLKPRGRVYLILRMDNFGTLITFVTKFFKNSTTLI